MLVILAKLIAVYVAITGAVFLAKPGSLTGYVGFWKQDKRLYLIGGSRILMGGILLWANPVCRVPGVVVILGIVMIIAGLPYFLISADRMKSMFSRWQGRSAAAVRVLGFSILAAGVLLFFAS